MRNQMMINLKKEDVREATELLRKAVFKKSRRDYKVRVMYFTRLFGFKFRSYERAKKRYHKTSYYTFIDDPKMYGRREWLWEEGVLQELDLMLKCDVRDVVSLPYELTRTLEKYLEC